MIEKSKKIKWNKSKKAKKNTDNTPLLNYGDRNIDPFSFIYFLAQKNTTNQFEPVYDSVHNVFELSADPLPSDGIIIPTPQANIPALFHNGKTFQSELLWKLFRRAVKDEKKIDQQNFKDVLKIPNVRIRKMTQSLFIINPKRFLPIDMSTEVISKNLLGVNFFELEKEIFEGGYEKYKFIIKTIKSYFPGCHFYEINQFLYLQSTKNKLINNSTKIFQVSANVYNDGIDLWDFNESNPQDKLTFKENSCVYTGGPGNKRKYPLTDPVRGDIVLVRFGLKQGKGIGVVNENEYKYIGGFDVNSAIRVFWINKSQSLLPHNTTQTGFSPAKPITLSAFQKADDYEVSFALIETFTREDNTEDEDSETQDGKSKEDGIVTNSLNTILYGPPGTGKTYNTAQRCVDICDGPAERSEEEIHNRYGELVVEGRVEFITFHQSYGYEEFVEGLRPDTGPTEAGDINSTGFRLTVTDGVLKRIADRARRNLEESENRQHYVLVIDEINRANVSKVIGELVTLLEKDKREGAKHEVAVTLPYSGEHFTLPANLYILGTMNTADRSIALLDTALRRRFEFEELPPDPEILRDAAKQTGIDLPNVLRTMNLRLEWLVDRDHLIGHAWLMEVQEKSDVDRIMRHKIIPLIAEYFYDDWNKVRAVLGGNDDFVRREKLPQPPSLDDIDDVRYSWIVQKNFVEGAYDRLISGRIPATELVSE